MEAFSVKKDGFLESEEKYWEKTLSIIDKNLEITGRDLKGAVYIPTARFIAYHGFWPEKQINRNNLRHRVATIAKT